MFEKEFWYKCPRSGCKSSFQASYLLDLHIRIHDNDLDICSYCPYRYADPAQYRRHLKTHFQIKDYECDQCDLKFPTGTELNQHYQIHEGIIYKCLICKIYECQNRNNMMKHMRRRHSDIVGKNFNWGIMKPHVKITK